MENLRFLPGIFKKPDFLRQHLKPPWRRLTNHKTLSDCRQLNFFTSGLASTSLQACHASREITTSQLILFYGQRGEWPKKSVKQFLGYKQETENLFSFSCFLQVSISGGTSQLVWTKKKRPQPFIQEFAGKNSLISKNQNQKGTDYGNKHLVIHPPNPQAPWDVKPLVQQDFRSNVLRSPTQGVRAMPQKPLVTMSDSAFLSPVEGGTKWKDHTM